MSIDPQSLGPAARAQILRKLQEEDDKQKTTAWIRSMEQKMKEKPQKKGVKSRPKYGNVKTTINGITFDSKKEAERYLVLMDELKQGKIRNLHLQEAITITPSYMLPDGTKIRAMTYVTDFTYERRHDLAYKQVGWFKVHEDVKGRRTQVYINKKKALEDRGIFITEV